METEKNLHFFFGKSYPKIVYLFSTSTKVVSHRECRKVVGQRANVRNLAFNEVVNGLYQILFFCFFSIVRILT